MLSTIKVEMHSRRLTDFHLKRIAKAVAQIFEEPITAYLSDVFISSSSAIGVLFCSGQLIPDTVLSFSSVFAGANPSLN